MVAVEDGEWERQIHHIELSDQQPDMIPQMISTQRKKEGQSQVVEAPISEEEHCTGVPD